MVPETKTWPKIYEGILLFYWNLVGIRFSQQPIVIVNVYIITVIIDVL